jgi:hypothetical protein
MTFDTNYRPNCLRQSAVRGRGYRRFATAAEAMRFVVEDFPALRTLGARTQVGDARYDSEDIRRLYEISDYPLRRRTCGRYPLLPPQGPELMDQSDH